MTILIEVAVVLAISGGVVMLSEWTRWLACKDEREEQRRA